MSWQEFPQYCGQALEFSALFLNCRTSLQAASLPPGTAAGAGAQLLREENYLMPVRCGDLHLMDTFESEMHPSGPTHLFINKPTAR